MSHKLTTEEMRRMAEERGGRFLSERYSGSVAALHEWSCSQGHRWMARPNQIRNGRWCAACHDQAHLTTMDDLAAMAAARGGSCLSTACLGANRKHLWRCGAGHQWQAKPNDVRQGSWCPCCPFKGEAAARAFLERTEGRPFPKARPSWLQWRNGKGLELDGYCEELGIAFEYHGQQHYFFTPAWHETPEGLADQQARDKRKREACAAHGVILIEIPDVSIARPSLKGSERERCIEQAVASICQAMALPMLANPDFKALACEPSHSGGAWRAPAADFPPSAAPEIAPHERASAISALAESARRRQLAREADRAKAHALRARRAEAKALRERKAPPSAALS